MKPLYKFRVKNKRVARFLSAAIRRFWCVMPRSVKAWAFFNDPDDCQREFMTLKQLRERWADLQYLHKHGWWKNGLPPEWVDTVRQDHFAGANVSVYSIEHVALEEIVEHLFRFAEQD